MPNPNAHSLFKPGETLHGRFFESAAKHLHLVAFRADGGQGETFTYGEAADLVERFAAGLRHKGLAAGTHIGLLSENRPEWCMAYMAILAAGCTVVPIDANLKEREISYIAGHSRLRTIIASGKFTDLVQGLPGVKLISFEADSPQNWRQIMMPAEGTDPKPAEVAALIYTSGTTGSPKGVELTHGNLLADLEGIEKALPFDKEDVFLSVLPLHHTFEATCGFLAPLMSGSSIVYARSLKSKEILEDIANNSVTIMCGVPLLFEKMYHSIRKAIGQAPTHRRIAFKSMYAASQVAWQGGVKAGKTLFRSMRQKAGLGSIRLFVSGGAAIRPSIVRFFNLIGFDFLQGYGLTECSPVVSVNLPDDIRFGSVGPPLENVEIRIENPDRTGIGEILVRGEMCTRGYRENPEDSAELIRDGWLYTGDLGRVSNNHLWITGRKKNLIISGAGKNIYPEEIEEKLNASGWISECIVYGRTRKDKQGEEVCAVIVPDIEQLAVDKDIDPASPDMEKVRESVGEVVNSINAHVATFKRLSNVTVQLEELEKTSTRKVKRYKYG